MCQELSLIAWRLTQNLIHINTYGLLIITFQLLLAAVSEWQFTLNAVDKIKCALQGPTMRYTTAEQVCRTRNARLTVIIPYTKKNWHAKFDTQCAAGETGKVASGPPVVRKAAIDLD